MMKLLALATFGNVVMLHGSLSMAVATCSVESVQALAPAGTAADAMIDSVKPLASPVAHCEILGHIITQSPGPNRVEFSLLLPDSNFNGRYYFVGLGAAAGVVPTASLDNPLNTGYVNTTIKLLSEGFAVAGSDTGHKGMMWDFGINNPVARLDHGHRGAHVSAVATQAITRKYYAMNDKLFRYHLGCSGGGRMGAMAVLHHPEDYDGVVASTGFGDGNSMWFPWILQHLLRNPDGWVSPPKLALLERSVAKKCAGPDGLVRDPNVCGFDPASLQCKGADSDECLTAAEIGMVKRVTGPHPVGPGKSSGGFTMTNPTGWSSFLLGNTRPTNASPDNPWAPGAPPSSYGISQSILRGFYFDDAKFDFMKDLDFNNQANLQRLEERHPDWGAISPDLSAFKKAGGKLILWAGLGENAVPPATEIQYHRDLTKTVPGTEDFMQLYLVPGVLHCAGGPGPQDTPDRLLEKVIAWAEQGKRPEAIIASAATPRAMPPAQGTPAVLVAPAPSRTVLLCPYPQTAMFNAKKGAFPYDASNWTCRDSR
jgi:feruloyl esterase